eukprot:6610077-Prymnesium_polylepis.1
MYLSFRARAIRKAGGRQQFSRSLSGFAPRHLNVTPVYGMPHLYIAPDTATRRIIGHRPPHL